MELRKLHVGFIDTYINLCVSVYMRNDYGLLRKVYEKAPDCWVGFGFAPGKDHCAGPACEQLRAKPTP